MDVKNMQIRVKKIEFSNEFRQTQFKLLPKVSFNINKINDTLYSVVNQIKIEKDEDNDSPIYVNLLVEGIFNFENATDDEIKEYMNKEGLESVFAYTRSILATTTAVAGIASINLPLFSFFKKNMQEKNDNNLAA